MADDESVEVPIDEGGEEEHEKTAGDKFMEHVDEDNKKALQNAVASATTDNSLITQWLAQTVFSAINLGAHVGASTGEKCIPTDLGVECTEYSMTRADKWTTSVESISLALALIVTLGHYCCMKYTTKYIMGKMPEGILSLVVLIFVAAGMPAIMNPDNQQALNTDGSILNANLYFFSWAGLAVAVYIFCTWLFHHCFQKRNLTAGVPSNKWYLLLAGAVIVMSSAVRLLDQNCETSDSKLCHRTKFAIAAGAMGTFCALIVSILSFTNRLSMWPEAITAGLVFVLFVLGIAFLTFGGENAPASNVGNFFFSTWICFLLSMFLASNSLKEIKKKRKGGDEEEEQEENQDEETPAEEDKAADQAPEQPAEPAASEKKSDAAAVAASF